MGKCIAKKLGLLWYQVETRFLHFFRENLGMLLKSSRTGDQVNSVLVRYLFGTKIKAIKT
jgi:hypothetical protein